MDTQPAAGLLDELSRIIPVVAARVARQIRSAGYVRMPRVEHDLDVQRQISDIVRGLQGRTPPGPAQMRNCQDCGSAAAYFADVGLTGSFWTGH
jgi:hypothetical protein